MIKSVVTVITMMFVALVIGVGCCIPASDVNALEDNYFPKVTGTDLQGNQQTFPQCLEKDKTILVVAFERWQQELCDAWYAKVSKYLDKNEKVGYYEVPTISKMNGFTRWFIYNGMRGGITDEEMRKKVITLHIDKKPFKELLNIDTEQTVYVYILDKEGKILENFKGSYDDGKWQKALKVLEENN